MMPATDPDRAPTGLGRLPYPLLCALLGLAFGWLPWLLHGPRPEKFSVLYLDGAIVVGGFHTARLLIGFVVGISTWPERWFLRGPLCGLLTMLPVSLVALANPHCGPRCMALNLGTAAAVGAIVAGLAFLATGKHHR